MAATFPKPSLSSLSLLNLFKGLKICLSKYVAFLQPEANNQNVCVLLFKDQRGSQSNGVFGTSTDINTDGLHVDQEFVSQGWFLEAPGDEGTSVLTSQIFEECWVFGLKSLQLTVQVSTDSLGDGGQVVVDNFGSNSTTQDHSGWVTTPGVELTVGHVGSDLVVVVVVTSGAELLGESDHVWGRRNVKVFVAPQLTSWTHTSAHFVNNHQSTVLQSQVSQSAEEVVRAVVVTTFGLNWLDQQGSNWSRPCLEQGVDDLQATVVFFMVLSLVFLQWVFVAWELSLGPFERRHVQFMDWLGAGDRGRCKKSSVEGSFERQNGQVWRTWSLVLHDGFVLFGGESSGVASLFGAVPHESGLESQLVSVSTGQTGPHLGLALGCDLQQAVHDGLEVLAGEIAAGWSVDDGINH